jgi:hypothetical protein
MGFLFISLYTIPMGRKAFKTTLIFIGIIFIGVIINLIVDENNLLVDSEVEIGGGPGSCTGELC